MKPFPLRLRLNELEPRALPSAPGEVEWLRQFGSVLPGSAAGRAVDADGNIYLGGTNNGALPGQGSAGGDDAFVRKFDAAGNVLWTRQFGTDSADRIHGVAADASGVYVVGQTSGTLPGQVSAGGTSDAFVRKYDVAGNELWTRQFGSSIEFDVAFDAAVDGSGVYVAGQIRGAAGDVFVYKYDASGNPLWNREFGTGGGDGARALAVYDSGVYVAGLAGGALPGQVAPFGGPFVRRYDTSGNEVWTRQFGNGADISAIAVDTSGVYVAGSLTGVLPGQTGAGGRDAFVRKYDTAGNLLWTHQFGATFPAGFNITDFAFGVAVDASGVYVAGSTTGILPGQSAPYKTGGLDDDAFVRKYDAAGNELWTRQFGTAGGDMAFGIAADAAGVYVTGHVGGALPGQTSTGGVDVFVRRYNAGGSEVWTRQFSSGAPATDIARAVDADGNVYVTGQLQGRQSDQLNAGIVGAFVRKYDATGNELWTRKFVGLPETHGIAVDVSGVYVAGLVSGALPGQTSAGSLDAFVRKYDADGNEIWTRQFGTGSADSAEGIAADASGIYVTGFTNGALPGQISAGGQDAFVRKYDSAGNVIWVRQFGSAGFDQALGVAADPSGVYVAGNTTGALPGQASAGSQDAFVRKYDGDGTEWWTRQFGTIASDGANGIAADALGVYLAGGTSGTLPGQTSSGSSDSYVRKYDASGAELWTHQFGSAGPDQANSVAVGATGVYVAGFVGGALPGQTGAGAQDAFVRKYDTTGTVIWTGQFGTAAADAAAGVAVGASGLYVAGSTTGAFPGQTSAGGQDAFVAKIVDAGANTAPSNISLSLNSAVDENGTATLNGSFADPDATDTHTVVIDWGPGEGTTTLNLAAGVTTFTASHLYRNDSPAGTPSDLYPVNVTVSDAGAGASAGTSLTVNNLAPMAGISGPLSGLSGDSLVFTLTAVDPSLVDQEAGFTFRIDWDGDGVADQTVTGSSGMTVAHAYPTPGTYNVRVTAEDQDRGVGDVATAAVSVLAPPAVQGLVWVDSNNDGEVNFSEPAIPGVTLTLTGIDDLGQSVHRVARTDENGVYVFTNLRPSNTAGYTVAEAQPAGFPDGRDALGTVDGLPAGDGSVNDAFSGIVLAGGLSAENYNFGERPAASGDVVAGQTATIGYWQNRNGQNLILALNGGAATRLGHWLAVTFSNLYGALDGKTNAEVAAFYKTLFARTSHSAPGGPPKTDAQVMAAALAVYVTNPALAGTTATGYGFLVTADGVGARTFNVGNSGAAFGAADHSRLTVMDLLLAVNARSRNGLLYDLNGDGWVDGTEAGLRTMANDVFSAINEAGDI